MRIAAVTLVALALMAVPADARVALQKVGTFAEPTYVTAPPGARDRFVVVQRRGLVKLVRDGKVQRRPFLDLRAEVLVTTSEGTSDQRGMLSLAFAPDYRTSGRFYVFYVDRQDRIRVDEVRRGARRAVLTIDGAGPLHHGGQLAFGPDGLLYVGIGYGDDERAPQDPASPRGKILRLDPARSGPPEVFALGLRNPYRFSFDARRLFVADVGGDGDGAVEEVTELPASTAPGVNLGWPLAEGDRGTAPNTVRPRYAYSHRSGWCSVVGGYVSRDPAVRATRGRYVHGDVCSGRIMAGARRLPLRVPYLVSFGQDGRDRLYAVSLSGGVWRLVQDT